MIANPVQQDITIYKDRDFEKTYIIKDSEEALLDISTWTVTSQVRPTYGSDTLIAQMVVTTVTGTSTITTTLDSLVTGAISVDNAISIGSTSTSSNMVWDMVVEAGEERYTLITGICDFDDTVTREVT